MSVPGEGVEVGFVSAGEVRFEVYRAGAPDSRRLALLLHGFPEHAISWRFQMPLLAGLGYKVWAPNLRGYGASTILPEVSDYHLDHLVDDVAALIDAADVDEVVLLAHDWGAMIAWAFAARAKRPLSHLVIMNVPHPDVAFDQMKGNWRQRLRSWYVLFFQLPWIPEWLLRRKKGAMVARGFRKGGQRPENYPDEVLEVYRENVMRPGGASAMVHYYRALLRAGRPEPLPPIETPTLMVWGINDIALGRELTVGTGEKVEDLTLRFVDASHWVQQDEPEVVNGMIEAFLAGGPVPDAPPPPGGF
ncbi:MAG: epoxide hydrolase [Deltaproteobacteria bacterium]|jgi:pimeloyl-ACP methyl ester carboxylesterase|nr:epoxide hydrolase [Deltaproteobacteria bacterium]